jgi:hypothetical protein
MRACELRRVSGLSSKARISVAPRRCDSESLRFVEREPWFGAVPFDEVADGMFVRSSRVQRGKTVENCRLGIIEVGKLENTLRFLQSLRHTYGLLAVAKRIARNGWFLEVVP